MKGPKTSSNQSPKMSHRARLTFLLLAVAMAPATVLAQWNSSYTLCAPQYTGVPFTYKPPAVDPTFVTNFQGSVDNDTGWTGAFRYVSSSGTAVAPNTVTPTNAPDGAFQIIQDSSTNHIYLSFQVNNDPTLDKEDSIILAFDPDHSSPDGGTTYPNMQRFIIQPLVQGTGDTSSTGTLPAGAIQYWKGWVKGTGWPNGVTTDPAFVTAVAQSTGASPTYTWNVQIRIDNSVLGLPAAPKNFGIYVNMVRVASDTTPTNTDTEFMWPAETPLGLLIPGSEIVLLGNSLPDPSQWGTGSLATSCSGVNISSGDITNNFPGTISLNNLNQFSVKIHNTGSQDAQQVFATFQIANYGLPAPDDWVRPGEAFNNLINYDPPLMAPYPPPCVSPPNPPTPPCTPLVTVPASGGTNSISTGKWQPGSNLLVGCTAPSPTCPTEEAYYQATPDTCIRVVLNSLNTNTIFSVRSTWENFETGNTSEFKHDAIVGTNGYKLSPGAANHEFLLTVTHDYTPACVDPKLIAKNPNLRYSLFQEVIHGCRITGKSLEINNKKFTDCEDVGFFGYNLRHDGPVDSFSDSLAGNGLEKRGNGYHLVVAPGKKATITTTVVSKGGRGEGGGHKRGCGEMNKRQGGATAAGILLIGLFTYLPGRKKRG